MNGGLIRDCKADDDGGAVDLGANCVFTMNGETIQNCSANDEGGAVIVKSKATFSMHGDAKIENCKAELGGGVHVKSSGNFTMSGGAIAIVRQRSLEMRYMFIRWIPKIRLAFFPCPPTQQLTEAFPAHIP